MHPFLYQLKTWRLKLITLALLFAVVAEKDSALRLIGRALQSPDDTTGVPADVAMLLLGGFIERGDKAASVVQKGLAPRVFWGRTEPDIGEQRGYFKNEADYAEEHLMRNGLSIDQLIKVDGCHDGSTADEAHCLRAYFELHPPFPRKVIIVTGWSHSRRAKWIFRKVFHDTDVEFTSQSVDNPETGNASNWWKKEETGFAVINEYIKWLFYLTHY